MSPVDAYSGLLIAHPAFAEVNLVSCERVSQYGSSKQAQQLGASEADLFRPIRRYGRRPCQCVGVCTISRR